MPCPQKVNISGIFSAYNNRYAKGSLAGIREYIKFTASKDFSPASECVGCGKCELHCPQGIEIRKMLNEAENELEGNLYKTLKVFGKK